MVIYSIYDEIQLHNTEQYDNPAGSDQLLGPQLYRTHFIDYKNEYKSVLLGVFLVLGESTASRKYSAAGRCCLTLDLAPLFVEQPSLRTSMQIPFTVFPGLPPGIRQVDWQITLVTDGSRLVFEQLSQEKVKRPHRRRIAPPTSQITRKARRSMRLLYTKIDNLAWLHSPSDFLFKKIKHD